MSTLLVYHGTNQEFDNFDPSKSRIVNDNYGGIAFFTDNMDIAHNYAKSMFNKKGGSKVVLLTELKTNKIFDVDDIFTGRELCKFYSSDRDIEDFARAASLLTASADKYDVIAKLKTGDTRLTGQEVFKGLSRGMTQTVKARDKLKSLGYDTLRYNQQYPVKHSVYVTFATSNIRITDRFIFDKAGNRYKLDKTVH